MSRVSISLPEQWVFSDNISIGISDINYGGHLANDAILRLCHEARLRFFKQHGATEANVFGTGIIVADAAIRYRKQGFYGDDLRVFVGVENIARAGFDMLFDFRRVSGNESIAEVKNGMVFFDYAHQKVTSTPAEFITLIQSLKSQHG